MNRVLGVILVFFVILSVVWATHDSQSTCPPRVGFKQSFSTLSSIACSAVGGALFVAGNWVWGVPLIMAPAFIEAGSRLLQGCDVKGSLGTGARFGLVMGLLFIPLGAGFVALTYPYQSYLMLARICGASIFAAGVILGAWLLGSRTLF